MKKGISKRPSGRKEFRMNSAFDPGWGEYNALQDRIEHLADALDSIKNILSAQTELLKRHEQCLDTIEAHLGIGDGEQYL